MKGLVEHKTLLFHNRARAILQHLDSEFRQAIKLLDRQWDENVFQLQQAKYTGRLQYQLLAVVHEIANNTEDENSRHIVHQVLTNETAYYLNEFQKMTRAM